MTCQPVGAAFGITEWSAPQRAEGSPSLWYVTDGSPKRTAVIIELMATLSTVKKVRQVLDLFATESPEWGVSDVATRLGMPRSSTHALLSSLADIGLLQWREGGRYTIGWRALELASARRGSMDVRMTVDPILQDLSRGFRETVHLAVLDRFSVLYVDRLLGAHNITVQGMPIGSRIDPHCTGVGKALVAYLPPEQLDEYLVATRRTQHTRRTLTDADELRTEFATIRSRGYALDRGELVADVYCVAAPIRDDLGEVVAALSMSAPVHRFEQNQETYIAAVKAAGVQASRALVLAKEGKMSRPSLPRTVENGTN